MFILIFSSLLFIVGLTNTNSPVPQIDTTVRAISWNINGSQIAIGDDNGNVQIIDTIENQIISSFTPISDHPSGITQLSWNPTNPDLLAIAIFSMQSPLLVVVDVNNLQSPLFMLSSGYDSFGSLAWHPNGELIAISTDIILTPIYNRSLEVWDVFSNQAVYAENLGDFAITTLDWNFDGTQLLSGDTRQSIIIRDFPSGEVQKTYLGLIGVPFEVKWSPDNRQIASGTVEGLFIWDAITGALIYSQNTATTSLDWSSNSRYLAITGSDLIQIYDLETQTSVFQVGRLSTDRLQQAIAYSPFSGRIAIVGASLNPESISSRNTNNTIFANGAGRIIIPNPSIDLLQTIAQDCNAIFVEQSLVASIESNQMTNLVSQIESLSDDAIPPACAADLIAVAEAIQRQ